MTGIAADINARVDDVHRTLTEHVLDGGRLAIVEAPPGSGKTYLLMKAAVAALRRGLRVAIATQTNTQADDVCRRFDADGVNCTRFASSSRPPVALGSRVAWQTDSIALPAGACIVIGTAAKWGLVDLPSSFDVVFVEEAWQLAWGDFMLLRQVAARFILIGDPGQVPPVVSTDVSRWTTAPRPPHAAAPKLLIAEDHADTLRLSLPATRRLPADTVDLIRSFYDFHFDAWARPGARYVDPGPGGTDGLDSALDLLRTGSSVAYTLPTPGGGPPLDCDEELADAVIRAVSRLLERQSEAGIDGVRRRLEPEDIGVCATHRIMNGAIEMRLPASLRDKVAVDTPERWQGLERKVFIMVHPLSGVVRPSAFDLETGRLCVMASRHRAGLIVVTRDHLTDTLDTFLPRAEQGLGDMDVAGRGLDQHLSFWKALRGDGRVVSA